MKTNKKWYKSKTVWVNMISVGLIVANWIRPTVVIPAGFDVMALGVINVLLRLITGETLTW